MILVTGGAGYIGSHTSVELIKNGYDIVIVARHAAEHAPFEALMEEMTSLLRQLGAAENKPEASADA